MNLNLNALVTKFHNKAYKYFRIVNDYLQCLNLLPQLFLNPDN